MNLLLEWLDARGIEAHAMGNPTQEEQDRPEYFRFWRRLPPRGQIAIFFGSWYTRPIFGAAHGEVEDAERERALTRIVDFERMLANENVLLVKLWLHITKKQQKKRLKKLESDPDNAWRVTKKDWRSYEAYDEIVSAASKALRRTSTGEAPWELIEAADKRHRGLAIAEHFLSRVTERLAREPAPPEPAEPLPVPAAVNPINQLDLTLRLDRDEYVERRDRAQSRLGRLARHLTEAGHSALLVFEGPDAAGKGGCIRRIIHPLDARFYRVVPIAAPTDEELAHPYLWRFWRRLPRRGQVTILDRSYYGRVLVERVEGYASPTDWRRAYTEINAFEEQLVDAGTIVAKFWLAISSDEQLARFQAREETGYKRYKITADDWRNREKWDAYEASAAEAIERTSSEFAPWTLVEAEDKRWARVKVLETLVGLLEETLG